MIQVNRSLQIQLMHLKGRIKRNPLCGSLLIKSWWALKRTRYSLRNMLGQYPLARPASDGYYELSQTNLDEHITPTLTAPHDIGVSCVASELDFHIPEFKKIFMELIEPVGKMERKSWEFVMATLALQKLECFGATKKGLGVGSGCEKPLYYYSRFSQEVIGTDLYLNDDAQWAHTAHSDVLANPSKYAPFSYPKEKLKLMHMNAMDFQFEDNSFDYAFSFSAIEHFGSRENIEKTMRGIERVLKPGGVAAITTELILNSNVSHDEYFNYTELQKHMIQSHDMELIGPLDLRVSPQDIEHVLDFSADMNKDIGIIFKSGEIVYTPLLLLFRKRA